MSGKIPFGPPSSNYTGKLAAANSKLRQTAASFLQNNARSFFFVIASLNYDGKFGDELLTELYGASVRDWMAVDRDDKPCAEAKAEARAALKDHPASNIAEAFEAGGPFERPEGFSRYYDLENAAKGRFAMDLIVEGINTPFCPLEEKFRTFVLRGLRNISEAP